MEDRRQRGGRDELVHRADLRHVAHLRVGGESATLGVSEPEYILDQLAARTEPAAHHAPVYDGDAVAATPIALFAAGVVALAYKARAQGADEQKATESAAAEGVPSGPLFLQIELAQRVVGVCLLYGALHDIHVPCDAGDAGLGPRFVLVVRVVLVDPVQRGVQPLRRILDGGEHSDGHQRPRDTPTVAHQRTPSDSQARGRRTGYLPVSDARGRWRAGGGRGGGRGGHVAVACGGFS